MKEDKYKYLPKFYDLETLTQEDLNKLALERNTLVKENKRLNNIINELEKDIEEHFKKEYPDRKLENYNLENCTYDYALVILGKLKELKEGKYMTAKEMFEKLEYEVYIDNDLELCYKTISCCISFDKKYKNVTSYENDFYSTSCCITLDELQAINKQVEELGWNNV